MLPLSRCRRGVPGRPDSPPRDIPVRFPRLSSVPSRGPQSRAFSGFPRSFYWVLIRPHVRATFEICVIVEVDSPNSEVRRDAERPLVRFKHDHIHKGRRFAF